MLSYQYIKAEANLYESRVYHETSGTEALIYGDRPEPGIASCFGDNRCQS